MHPRLRSTVLRLAGLTLSLAVAVGLIALWGLLAYSSALAVPAIALGNVVLARPATRSVGSLEAGRRYEVAFPLTNLTSESITIIGMRAPCTCVSIDALPMKLSPRASRTLRLLVAPTSAQVGKPFSQTIDLHLSVPSPRVSLSVVGRIEKGTASP